LTFRLWSRQLKICGEEIDAVLEGVAPNVMESGAVLRLSPDGENEVS